MESKESAKRYIGVSLKMVKERSFLYADRRIKSSRDARTILIDYIGDADRENFIGLYLNTKNEPVAIQIISIGSLNAAVIHPRECFKTAYLCNAASVIFCHNHPSGDTTPSPEDRKVADRLVKCGDLLGIDVLDFCIVSNNDMLSFREACYL